MVNEIASENIQHSRLKQKKQYDKNTKEPNYNVGQTVLLHKPQDPKGFVPKTTQLLGWTKLHHCRMSK